MPHPFNNLPKNLQEKADQADKLKRRTSSGSFLNKLIGNRSSMESAFLYEEVGDELVDREEKTHFYEEAAKMFLGEKDEYGDWRGSECYVKIYKLFLEDNREVATSNLLKSCEILKDKNYVICGQNYQKLGLLWELDEVEKAIGFYKLCIENYEKIDNWESNLKMAKKKLLGCYIIMKNFEEIEKLLQEDKLCIYNNLCLCMMYILGGKFELVDEEDFEEKKEEDLLHKILRSEKGDVDGIIMEYRDREVMDDLSSLIFDLFVEYYTADESIC